MKKVTAKCIFPLGITEKELVETGHPGLFKIKGTTGDEYSPFYYEFDGYMWPTSHRAEQAEREKNMITRELVEQHWQHVIERLYHQYTINLGIAEYLGKLEEGKRLKAELRRRRDEEQAEREAKRKAKQDAERAAHEAAIKQAQVDFTAGKQISGDHFLELCKRHGVDIPLRTHGWAKRSLSFVSKGSYVSSSTSTAIPTVIARLANALEQ